MSRGPAPRVLKKFQTSQPCLCSTPLLQPPLSCLSRTSLTTHHKTSVRVSFCILRCPSFVLQQAVLPTLARGDVSAAQAAVMLHSIGQRDFNAFDTTCRSIAKQFIASYEALNHLQIASYSRSPKPRPLCFLPQ